MRLCEHPDFDQFILGTTQWLQGRGLPLIREDIVEKDYFVTEVLRIVADYLHGRVIFKGGTSLSKGWGIIQRFSEDVDLFVNPARFTPALSRSGVTRELGLLKDRVAQHPHLSWLEEDSRETSSKARADVFAYKSRFDSPISVPSSVLLEAGVRSGDHPTDVVELGSYVSRFLSEMGISDIADDLSAFPMTLLHFRRTFVEKLFTIHSKVEIMLRDGGTIGRHARHYYDLAQLASQPEVLAMLSSDEFALIKEDYRNISGKHFKFAVLPDDMSLGDSPALFPTGEMRSGLADEYLKECGPLCYSEQYPSFDDVLGALENIRELL